MKISSIYLKDFLGVHLVSVETPQPVQLFAGGNAAGKSSIRDAVALAITGQLPRVALKKDVAELVRVGADGADCEVCCDGDDPSFSFSITRAGKLTQSKSLRPDLAAVMDAQRFAQMKPDERRAFLFDLMRVKLSLTAIVAELLQAGHDKDRVAVVQPLLRTGFPDAAAEAKSRATAAKGSWRQITGEQWGSDKGAHWTATAPAVDDGRATEIATKLKHCDTAIASWNETKGKLKAAADYRAQLQRKLPELRELAGFEQRLRDKLAADQAELARLKPQLERALAEAGTGPRVGIMHELAAAMQPLIRLVADFELKDAERPILQHAQLVLANYEALHGRVGGNGDPDAVGRAERLKKAVDLCQSAIAQDERDLTNALEAKAQLIHIEAELAQEFDADGLKQADAQIAELTEERSALQAEADELKNLKIAAARAEERTRDAAKAHADVMAWDALGDELSPAGLPARLLARALHPINARLEGAATETDWPQVVIGEDMSIKAGGRDYRLLSVSERWRVDAMIAEAISHLSGARLLVLDGFDVIEPAGRGALIGWLAALVEDGELDTALVFATLKEPPKGLPESLGVHWLTGGNVLHNLKEAA